MAEFALGLTKTAVEGTLSRVQTAIEEEAKLRVKVQNDLVFITGEFEMMQSFLKVANKEQANNQVVRTWVRQLRTLAFDVEDCVEFVVHLDNKPVWWWRLMPSCVGPPRQLDDAAVRIAQLKARVEDLSQRNTRYNLISDSGSDSKAITVVEQPVRATANETAFQALCEVWKATGKWRGVGDLEKLINSEGDDLQVISVWGNTGGADLGTTPIFNKAYNDPEICQEFKSRAWVKLGTPFNPDEFRHSLLTQICATAHKTNKGVKASEGMQDDLMQEIMTGQRYLVILEEVTTMVEWDVIRTYLPESNNGSRIVVSTKQLRTALFCTGKPYQVSDLTYHQPLFAFSKKALRHRSIKGELIWQIRSRGVISVWGTDDKKTCHRFMGTGPSPEKTNLLTSSVIRKVYSSIMYKSKQFEGVEFERHSWVDVPVPFDLEVLARRLLVHFRSEDLQVEEISAVGLMRDPDLTQECCRFLRQKDCLLVINGLRSTHDWDLIKAAFLSERIRGCIIVITIEESVATYCVDDKDGALNMKKDLEADPVLRPLIKGCQLHGTGGKGTSCRGHALSTRMEEARNCRKFKYTLDTGVIWEHLICPGVSSMWGTAGAGKSTAARNVYYSFMRNYDMNWKLDYVEELQTDEQFYSWVDVPHPFNLRVFFQLLFLDFHSYDLGAKETAAISMMEGLDPIQWCRELLLEKKCLVVIDGLRSTHDWDLIRLKPKEGTVFVITNEPEVATHCAAEDRVFRFRSAKHYPALPPLVKACTYGRKEASLLFSNMREEARGWTIPTFKLLGCQIEAAAALIRCIKSEDIISVWGIAGVGKSAIVRNVYSHIILGLPQCLNVKTEYSWWRRQKGECTMTSWVDVSHPFNLADLSSRMLLDFNSHNLQAKQHIAVGIIEGQDPIQVCRKFLCEERCLVVIDGLLTKDDWDYIKAAFLPEITKSCIIVITNEATVARHCVNNMEDRVVNVKGLEADAALSLFKKVSGHGLTDSEEMVSRDIMAKCGGIPKVLNIIGEYLKSSDPYFLLDTLTGIRDDFMVMLETKPEFYNLSGLFYWMRRYFDTCPDLVKPCIFYLSVFGIGDNIRRRRLVRRWIAEGYCRDKFRSTTEDNRERLPSKLTSRSTAEENGERLFSNLLDLSIIQQQRSKVLCQVNGFFHECIISLEDNLVFALEGHCSLNSQRAGQHLTIGSSWDRDKTVFESLDFSRVRSFTVAGNWEPFFMSSDTKMSVLRVLDLENTSGLKNDDLELIGKLVPCLKFLSIRGCKEITRLPDSVGDLSQLQTLDVKNTSIVRLPQSIIQLQKMQYIRAGNTVPSWDEGRTVTTLAPWDEGGTVAILPATNEDRASTSSEFDDDTESSTRSTIPPWDEGGAVTILPVTNEDRAPTTAKDNDTKSSSKVEAAPVITRAEIIGAGPTPPWDECGTMKVLPATNEDRASTPAEVDSDTESSTSGSSKLEAVALTTPEEDGDGTGEATAPTPAEDVAGMGQSEPEAAGVRSRNLVHSWLSNICSSRQLDTVGVKVPAGIGKLMALHTLGVVNVNVAGGKAFLKALTELTQLRRLRVSGITGKTVRELFSAISTYGHLESLWVRFDKDKQSPFVTLDDTINRPPETIKSLKLYGHVKILGSWMPRHKNLKKVVLEMTILKQEDIYSLYKLTVEHALRRLCFKPIGELNVFLSSSSLVRNLKELEIDCTSCSSDGQINLRFSSQLVRYVEVLKVHCSSGSSLRLSGILELKSLREVWLKGPYGDTLKQIQQQLAKWPKHRRNKPVLKRVQGHNGY